MIHIISPAVLTDQFQVNTLLITKLHSLIVVFQFLIAGVLRGSGRQFLGAAINAFSYYVFGLPIGISLALATDLGVKGMWIGLNIANFIQVEYLYNSSLILHFILGCLFWCYTSTNKLAKRS